MTDIELSSLEQQALISLIRAAEDLVNGLHALAVQKAEKAIALLIVAANISWKEHTDASLR